MLRKIKFKLMGVYLQDTNSIATYLLLLNVKKLAVKYLHYSGTKHGCIKRLADEL